ncbi:hypothetical protein LRS06_07130 [Hymenobacter sp. J193]|uniref:hypothetical protein n=1 Tax=Hymenobacter sp. J193 TaxID=2898429 RepID=UPI0021517681|nr:hypothetical protein [Hymenobacter sp. J193]MCR5887552.1 hypothetical protein [Hymenobacter sp. J193]
MKTQTATSTARPTAYVESANSLYSMLPFHIVHYAGRADKAAQFSLQRLGQFIGSKHIPFEQVKAIAAEIQASGKFKNVPAEVVESELSLVHKTARKANYEYEV